MYGLTASAVAERTREIGIRMSLGASPAGLLRDLLAQGLRLCLVGTAIGLVGALLLARFLRRLLFGVAASDNLTILVVVATMTAVVAAATLIPASRAARIDPIAALRQD
ncbi:MAG TPA: FtsX-like permease family protein [Vicinamibacterales bacterium]|nr:FtsX-like permease family protein [Vicinamibacterales bacterium]